MLHKDANWGEVPNASGVPIVPGNEGGHEAQVLRAAPGVEDPVEVGPEEDDAGGDGEPLSAAGLAREADDAELGEKAVTHPADRGRAGYEEMR